jgi:hypothetical protein
MVAEKRSRMEMGSKKEIERIEAEVYQCPSCNYDDFMLFK